MSVHGARANGPGGLARLLDGADVVQVTPGVLHRLACERRLDITQELGHRVRQPRQRHALPFAAVAPDDRGGLAGQVAWADLDAHRNALELPLGDAPAEAEAGAAVDAAPDASAPERLLGGGDRFQRAGLVADGDDDGLDRVATAARRRRRGT